MPLVKTTFVIRNIILNLNENNPNHSKQTVFQKTLGECAAVWARKTRLMRMKITSHLIRSTCQVCVLSDQPFHRLLS